MIILQLDSEQLGNLIKNSVRNVIAEQSISNQSSQDQLLSLKEAAEFLKLAPQTIYGFTSNRSIPFIKKGKKLLFKKSLLEKWLLEGSKGTKEEIISHKIIKQKN